MSLDYGFYNDRFYSVYITFKNTDNLAKIKNALLQEHGNPSETDHITGESSCNVADKVTISLDYNDRHKLGNVSYLFKPISDQQEKDNS